MEIKEKLLARAYGTARFWLLGVLVLAVLARLVVLFGFTDFNSSASVDPYPEMATYILDGQGMSKYYEDGSVRPVTSHGPLYPLVSAGFLLVSSRSWLVVRLAQVILSVVMVLLVYQVGRCAMNKEAGLMAAFLTAFYPPLVRFSADLMTETLFAFILILVVYFGLRFVREWTGWLALWLGVVLGLLILTKIKGLFIAIAFLPLLMVLARGRCLRWAVVPFVVAMIIYSPWVIRNSVLEHTFLPFGSGFGEAVLSGQDVVFYEPDMPGETAGQRSQSRFIEGIRYVVEQPAEFAQNTGKHFLRMWFNLGFDEVPSLASILFAAVNLIALVIGTGGAVMLYRRPGPERDLFYLVATILVVFTAVHLGTLAVGRYSVPLMPLVFLMAAYPLVYKFLSLAAALGRDKAAFTKQGLGRL